MSTEWARQKAKKEKWWAKKLLFSYLCCCDFRFSSSANHTGVSRLPWHPCTPSPSSILRFSFIPLSDRRPKTTDKKKKLETKKGSNTTDTSIPVFVGPDNLLLVHDVIYRAPCTHWHASRRIIVAPLRLLRHQLTSLFCSNPSVLFSLTGGKQIK